jgi:hypothetical protein
MCRAVGRDRLESVAESDNSDELTGDEGEGEGDDDEEEDEEEDDDDDDDERSTSDNESSNDETTEDGGGYQSDYFPPATMEELIMQHFSTDELELLRLKLREDAEFSDDADEEGDTTTHTLRYLAPLIRLKEERDIYLQALSDRVI